VFTNFAETADQTFTNSTKGLLHITIRYAGGGTISITNLTSGLWRDVAAPADTTNWTPVLTFATNDIGFVNTNGTSLLAIQGTSQ
jgi:hypothetical protein